MRWAMLMILFLPSMTSPEALEAPQYLPGCWLVPSLGAPSAYEQMRMHLLACASRKRWLDRSEEISLCSVQYVILLWPLHPCKSSALPQTPRLRIAKLQSFLRSASIQARRSESGSLQQRQQRTLLVTRAAVFDCWAHASGALPQTPTPGTFARCVCRGSRWWSGFPQHAQRVEVRMLYTTRVS